MTPFEQHIIGSGMKFHPVVPFAKGIDTLTTLDLTADNSALTEEIYTDTDLFARYVDAQRQKAGARYAIGGYNEHRTIYNRSNLFDEGQEPRRLHLGLDIWGEAGTPVLAVAAGSVHSFANNAAFGDYGGTIILSHQTGGMSWYSLYGHLSVGSLAAMFVGKKIGQGEMFAVFGEPKENGGWPPHLHFQLIVDIGDYKGDYPGVCRYSERVQWLRNSPDPDLVLGWKG